MIIMIYALYNIGPYWGLFLACITVLCYNIITEDTYYAPGVYYTVMLPSHLLLLLLLCALCSVHISRRKITC